MARERGGGRGYVGCVEVETTSLCALCGPCDGLKELFLFVGREGEGLFSSYFPSDQVCLGHLKYPE